MSSLTFTNGSATISNTEYWLASNSTSKVNQTTQGRLYVMLDCSALLTNDEFRGRIYDKVNGGTQQPIVEWTIKGPYTQLVEIPVHMVGEAWEVSLLRISSVDRAIGWSLRLENSDNASNVALSTAGVTAAQAGLGTTANQTLILAAVSNIAVTGAALNATAGSQTITTGSGSGGVANTTQADGTYDTVSDTAGTLEFYDEFDVSATSGAVGVGVDWLGYVVGLVNTIKVFARNWGSSSWEQIGSIVGIAGTANMSEAWELTSAHTQGGLVRIRFQATGLTSASVKTDRILLGYAVVPPTVAAIQSGLATSTALATAQTAITDVQTDVDELQVSVAAIPTAPALATALATAQTAITDIQTDVDELQVSVAAIPTAPALATALATAQTAITDIQTDVDELQTSVAAIPTSPALAATALSTADWTPTRAAKLDDLDATISSRAAAATALSTADYSSARAAKLDDLDAAISTRAAASALATAQAAITAIKANTDNLPSDPADESLIISATNAIMTAVGLIPTTPALAADLTTLQGDVTDLSSRLPAALDGDGNIVASLSTDGVTAIADAVMYYLQEAAPAGATTFIQRQRIIWSILASIARGLAISTAGSEAFRDGADSKDRATFELLPDGTRTPGTFDGD